MRVARHDDFGHVDALGTQGVEFAEQHRGVDDDTVADDRGDMRVEDA